MANNLNIVMAQLNFTVGDIANNVEKHLEAIKKAKQTFHADMIIFSELSLVGYAPEDLLLRPHFIREAMQALEKLTREISDIYCVIGHPLTDGQTLFNACSMLYKGKTIARYAKQMLPNYGVFDEARYFNSGNKSCVTTIQQIPIGLVICEDLWKIGPTYQASLAGAKLIISPNASPFEINKHEQRLAVLSKRAKSNQTPIIYVNQIGGQDELVFDGGSMMVDKTGELVQFAGFHQECLHPLTITTDTLQVTTQQSFAIPHNSKRIFDTLVLSIRDYVYKNHFKSVILGLSGGIDSALVLVLAVAALGSDKVHALLMPSPFTADISLQDARLLAETLQVKTETISIDECYQSFLATLQLSSAKVEITEQNIQARIRAILLMARSNSEGHLVLSTGNRSEIAVGYCTLYGDMAGGFAPLKDVPKMLVYELARYCNSPKIIIPERILTRPPTAELAHNQLDEDSLPPYPILDKILEYYIDQSLDKQSIVQQGFAEATVQKVISLIQKNEYKRRQAAIGPHINHHSFGKDWRYPITNGFKP